MPSTYTTQNQGKLCVAAYNGNTEEVERLVSQRLADPNKETGVGRLALCGAAVRGQTDTVVTLVRLGADVNRAESAGDRDTPLTRAAKNGKTETVARLLELGAEATKANGEGATPASLLGPAGVQEALAAAAEGGHAKVVAALVELGADLPTST